LDIFAHALWTTALGIVARPKLKHQIHLGWAAAWAIFPDVVAFIVRAAVRIEQVLTGASRSLLPTANGTHFDWVWGLYNCTHSTLVFTTAFGMVWWWLGRPALEMLGWALHIVIDIFTHRGLFAIQFLWPASRLHFDGIRWEMPSFLAVNYAVMATVYLLLWIRRADGAHHRE
jgi:hypothetical protein